MPNIGESVMCESGRYEKSGELVVEDGRNYLINAYDRAFEVQTTSVILWNLCDGEKSLHEIRDGFAAKTGVAKEKIPQYILENAIVELQKMNLVK